MRVADVPSRPALSVSGPAERELVERAVPLLIQAGKGLSADLN